MIISINLDIELMKALDKSYLELDNLKYKLIKEQRIIEEAINLLRKDKHKELIKLHYIEGMTLTEISELWGDNRSTIGNMKVRILNKIEKYLSENDTK